MTIVLHIERLMLAGLPVTAAQGPLVQAAVEAELARLLAAEGVPPGLDAGRAVPSVPGGSLQLAHEGGPSAWGTQIAQAVYGGLGKT